MASLEPPLRLLLTGGGLVVFLLLSLALGSLASFVENSLLKLQDPLWSVVLHRLHRGSGGSPQRTPRDSATAAPASGAQPGSTPPARPAGGHGSAPASAPLPAQGPPLPLGGLAGPTTQAPPPPPPPVGTRPPALDAGQQQTAPRDVRSFCESLPQVPKRTHPKEAPAESLKSFEDQYAIDDAVLADGMVLRDTSRMRRVLQKLAANEGAFVQVFGGSFAMGAGCGETSKQPDSSCAWSARAKRWWQQAFPGNASERLQWENRANHGISSEFLLNGLGAIVQGLDSPPDIVFVDTTVNDAASSWKAQHLTALEALIRAFHTLLPDTQLILVEDGCVLCLHLASERRKVAEHYGVPTIDYAAVVQKHNKAQPGGPDRFWPSKDAPLKALRPGGPGVYMIPGTAYPDFQPTMEVTKGVCCPNNHPNWQVHQYYADLVSWSLLQMLQGACSSSSSPSSAPAAPLPAPLAPQTSLDRISGCLRPLSNYNAHEPPEGGSGVTAIGWSLTEDVPGRPGWISTTTRSTIRFEVRFGPHALLSITYLRSYEGVGTATVKVTRTSPPSGSAGPEARLDARWTDRFSLPFTFVAFNNWDNPIKKLLNNQEVSAMKRKQQLGEKTYVDAVVEITHTGGPKFKVLSVVSC